MSAETIKAWIEDAIKAVDDKRYGYSNFCMKKAREHFKRLKQDKKKAPD